MQVIRDVEEQHEVVLILRRLDDRTNIFNLIVAGLLPSALLCHLKRVDIVSRLDVDAVFLLVAASLAHSSEFLRTLRVHHNLVGRFELRSDFFRNKL